jgi:hypothetical protein
MIKKNVNNFTYIFLGVNEEEIITITKKRKIIISQNIT